MPVLPPIELFLWVAPHLLLVAVVLVMMRKGEHLEFPIFFTYLLFEFLQFAFLVTAYLLHASFWVYVKADIFLRAGSTVLHFGILNELFVSPVKDDVTLHQSATRTLRWITGTLIILASAFVAFQYFNSHGHRLLRHYATLEAMNIAQCFVLALVFLWYRFLGRKMSGMEFGIMLGLGVTSSLEPLIEAWKDSLTAGSSHFPDYLQMAVYHVSVLIWLVAALAHRKGGGTGTPPRSGKLKLQELNESAAEMERVVRL